MSHWRLKSAQFQEGQPHKYYETLESVSKSLGSINHLDTRALIFVLCPKSRKSETNKKISTLKEDKNAAVVTWEDVLKTISKTISGTGTISNPTTKIVAQEFCAYLERHFSFIEKFESKVAHLRKSFPDYGSPYQGELVSKLWPTFPAAGGRMSKGKTWIGYYFYADPEIGESGWFGFVPAEEIDDGRSDNKAELLIASTYAPELSSSFRRVKLKNDNFIGAPGKTNFWVINFDSGWCSVDIWREELSPFWQAVREQNKP